ncbi:MAG: phosphatidylglycerophosphatase A [Campylobacterales bacterium]|nr:phosphatidylglycerophosphatase A [Campylobacterales bacterium]
MSIRSLITIVFGFLSGVTILLFLDVGTLFLAALLLAIITVKTQNTAQLLDKVFAPWFALSVAPAKTVSIDALGELSNGFIIMTLLGVLFFSYFYMKKPSIIGRFYANKNSGVGSASGGSIAGFAAGILSAIFWQAYLQLAAL